MAQFTPAASTPVVLGVALTIARHASIRSATFGVRTRSVGLRIDPSLDLLYLIEATLSSNLECLVSLTKPGVESLTLRAARLELIPDPVAGGTAHGPTLMALATGNCFVTAQSSKVLIASFDEPHVTPAVIHMDVRSHVNLLDYLRAEWFTLELSGTHRRRMSRSLALRLQLEFETHQSAWA
ncbi:hypothetical protein GCM10027048_19090 [Hymenobacter coalescens]